MDPVALILPALIATIAASAQVGSILILVWTPPHQFGWRQAIGAIGLTASAILLAASIR